MRYTVRDLRADFPDEAACLRWLLEHRYPDSTCPRCQQTTQFYRLKQRRAFICRSCHYHLYPLKQTIFAGSTTPLDLWFHAIYQLASHKAGYSAMQLEREIGVTYKTAFRMLHQIRSLMQPPERQLQGAVEIDESFIHANPYKRSSAYKTWGRDARRQGIIIFGLIERGGPVKTFTVQSTGARVLLPLIEAHVAPGTTIYTDGYLGYRTLAKRGYIHRTVEHGSGQFHNDSASTQNIENVWSHFKRGIKGVHRHISADYAEAYSREFAWRLSHRGDESMFWSLMLRL